MDQIAIYDETTGVMLADLADGITAASDSRNRAGAARCEVTWDDATIARVQALRTVRGLPELRVMDRGRVLWRGRVEDRGLLTSGGRVQAFGYQNALRDTTYTAAWSIAKYERWERLTGDQIAGTRPDKYESDTTNRLFVHLKEGEQYANGVDYGAWGLRRPNGDTGGFAGLMLTLTINLPANWALLIQSRDETFGGATSNLLAFTSTGVQVIRSYFFTFAAVESLVIVIYNNTGAASTPAAGSNYFVQATNVRAVRSAARQVNTTLTSNLPSIATSATVADATNIYPGQLLIINSGAVANDILTVASVVGSTVNFTSSPTNAHGIGESVQGFSILASDVAADLVASVRALNSSQLAATTARILTSALDLDHAEWLDARPADILEALTLRASITNVRWRWRVDESKALIFAPDTGGRTWYVDAEAIEDDDSIAELASRAYAVYQDAGGRELRTAAATVAAVETRRRLVRVLPVRASGTVNAAIAAYTRDTELAQAATRRSRKTLAQTYVTDGAGAVYPVDVVQPGDTLAARNLDLVLSVDLARSFIVEEIAIDRLTGRATFTPSQTPPTIAAVLGRSAAQLR